MSKHTPGEWLTLGEEWDYGVYSSVENEDDNPDDVQIGVIWRIGDARLIAAAPDLLAACEAVLADHEESLLWGEFGLTDEALEQVKQAIKKAKGESSD